MVEIYYDRKIEWGTDYYDRKIEWGTDCNLHIEFRETNNHHLWENYSLDAVAKEIVKALSPHLSIAMIKALRKELGAEIERHNVEFNTQFTLE